MASLSLSLSLPSTSQRRTCTEDEEPPRKIQDFGTKKKRQIGKLYNDCVHGNIILPPLCVAIINTPIFDRLRNVKQMGFTNRVYPGASHNRFEHSIGVCYLAGSVVNILNETRPSGLEKISYEEKVLIQVAGLCHDLGHGPFSHSWETFVNRANESKNFEHEDISAQLFERIWNNENVKEKRDELFKHNAKDAGLFVKELINGFGKNKSIMTTNNIQKGLMYFYEIISNKKSGIDVDKWDYLLRDGKQLNLKITFDSQRLMQCLRICKVNVENDQQEYHICYRDKEMDNIMQMYIMRGELHKKAAYHRVGRCIDEMWIDALIEAEYEEKKFCGNLLSEAHENLEVYEQLDDHIFHNLLYQHDGEKKKSQKLLERIVNRKLYTCVWRDTVNVGRYNIKGEEEENVKERKEKMKDKIYKKVKQIRNSEGIDLYVTHSSQTMHDLPNNVFLYQKDNDEIGEKFNESFWKSALLFPIELKEMIRIEMFFYCKEEAKNATEMKEKIEELKKRAIRIMKDITE